MVKKTKLNLLIAVLIAYSALVNADQQGDQTCKEMWPNDEKMQTLCQERLKREKENENKLTTTEKIKLSCEQEWPDDYRMQEHCISKERQAVKSINSIRDKFNISGNIEEKYQSGHIPTKILVNCMRQWESEYRMIVHCFEKQAESAKRLNKF